MLRNHAVLGLQPRAPAGKAGQQSLSLASCSAHTSPRGWCTATTLSSFFPCPEVHRSRLGRFLACGQALWLPIFSGLRLPFPRISTPLPLGSRGLAARAGIVSISKLRLEYTAQTQSECWLERPTALQWHTYWCLAPPRCLPDLPGTFWKTALASGR